MAAVYLATDLLLNRAVAVKMLHQRFAGDREFVERFRREAQAAASLSHPNVVNIYDVGQDGDIHYIVLEYVRGRNLKDILRHNGPLPLRQATFVARAVCAALDAAHRRGLIHRDIKPHNILITDEGRVKVTDFGIARAASSATLTQTGTLIGSVHYFSPEQARGHPAGPETDIYSLGVVLYEMLTGRLPFTGDTPISVALKHIQEPPVPPSRWRRNLPPRLEAIVLKALAKNPEERYRTPAEMLADLRQFNRQYVEEGPDDGYPETAALASHVLNGGRETERARASRTPVSATVESASVGSRRGEDDTALGEEPTQVVAWGHRARVGSTAVVEPLGSSNRRRPQPSRAAATSVVEETAEPAEGAAKDRNSGRRRSRRWVFWLLLFLSGYLGMTQGAPRLAQWIFPPDVQVPNVIGLHVDEARAVLAAQGLEISVERRVHHPEIPQFHVMNQNPEPERTVRMGRTIQVTMSLGPDRGPVPDVTNLPERQARLLVTQQGFTLGEVHEEFREDVPLNTVVRQSPAPGEILERGKPIDLWVSRQTVSAPRITVPDFRGRTLDEVRQLLAELSLTEGNLWPEYSDATPPGRIIDQNPAPFEEVEVGSSVDFVYSAQREAEAGRASDDTGRARDGSSAENGRRRERTLSVYVPDGPPQEVVVLIIDDFGAREIFREVLPGGSRVQRRVEARGSGARIQVYMGGALVLDTTFGDTD